MINFIIATAQAVTECDNLHSLSHKAARTKKVIVYVNHKLSCVPNSELAALLNLTPSRLSQIITELYDGLLDNPLIRGHIELVMKIVIRNNPVSLLEYCQTTAELQSLTVTQINLISQFYLHDQSTRPDSSIPVHRTITHETASKCA